MRKLLLVPLCMVPFAVWSQGLLGSIASQNSSIVVQNAQVNLKLGDIDKAVVYYSMAVNDAKANRNAGKGVDGTLLAEYAYALVLHHDYEAAFANIDRAKNIGTKYADFYSAQILQVVGCGEAAKEFMAEAKIPEWINGVYQILTPRYSVALTSLGGSVGEDDLDRANRLTANRQSIQAVAVFERLILTYPDVYILYADYSSLWEGIGHFAYAHKLLCKAVNLIPADTSTTEMKKAFAVHLNKLHASDSTLASMPLVRKSYGWTPPKGVIYVGTSAASKLFSLNGKLGLCTSRKFSSTVNMGISIMDGKLVGSIGLSAYKSLSIFMIGIGISDQFSADYNSLGVTPVIGLSFLDKSKTSSFDITFSPFIPITSDGAYSYSISIGKTYYIDIKEKEK